MDIKVMIPSPKLDFINFDSASTSPYISAPSSPQNRFNTTTTFYYSAPTSPNRVFTVYNDGEDAGATSSSVPFGWEEKPGLPKSSASSNYGDAEEDINDLNSDNDFAFDFSGQFETASLHADELFDGGKIKPLKPPPRFEFSNSGFKPPESPRSPKKMIQEAFVRKKKDYDFDPFQTALEIQTRKENFVITSAAANRGRSSEKANTKHSHSRRKSSGTRSLSPFRVSDLLLDPEEKTDPNPSSSSMFPSFWYKKWKIKDLLLFRSASESRASELRKASNVDRDAKNSSFRSMDSGSVGSVSSRRRTGPRISAHELHYYNMSRAVSEEMKKRTFLPYKQGLLGCLGFIPSVPNMSR